MLQFLFIGSATPASDSEPAWREPQDRAADSAAIEAFWSKLDSTWNARDAERFIEFFTEDASFAIVGSGRSFEARAAIHQRFVEQFRSQRPGLRHVTRPRQIHTIVPDVIVVDGLVEILDDRAEGDGPTVVRSLAITALMVRASEGWRIRLLRGYPLSERRAGP